MSPAESVIAVTCGLGLLALAGAAAARMPAKVTEWLLRQVMR